MSFANPWFLTFFVPLAFAAWRLLRRGRRSGIRFSAVNRLPARAAGWRAQVAALTPFVLLAGLSLLVLAAARPRTSLAHEKKSVDAIAIAMTVDISGSMMNPDLAPKGARDLAEWTRIAIVKRCFAEFVRQRPDDLIGLVTFGGYASTPVPLTADHEALLHALKGVEVAVDAEDEEETLTAMGDGLATALLRLKNIPLKSKVIILLSDGVSNVGATTPEAAAEAAKKMGVRIYVIGIGVVPEYVDVPVGFFGQKRRIRVDGLPYADQVKVLGFDERQLRSLAKTTGGAYFPVKDSDSIEKALEEIDQLETTQIDADVYNRWNEHFAWFLLAGALLVLAAATLSMSATRRLA